MIYETIVIAGIILILIAIAGNKKIEFEKMKIGDLTDVQRSIIGVLGIIVLILGIWQPFLEGDRINGVPTPTPTLTPTPTSTPTSIIDTMDSTSGWETYIDDESGSSINIKSITGRTGNAIEISYDLKERGEVAIYKEINPEILSGKDGIKFFYKGGGEPNTIDLGLRYGDVGETLFGVGWERATVTDDWVTKEAPYTYFDCWWPDDNCQYYGNKLDLKNVRKIWFCISNNPDDGDVCGSGRVIIDDVQGITS